MNVKDALGESGPFAVWELMDGEEQRAAAAALWKNADRDTRVLLEMALAKELKFRPQSIRKLPTEKVVSRLARMADDLPENMLFQYLFHFHMTDRRHLLGEFLDHAEVPHNEGVLDLPDDYESPDPAMVEKAAADLIEKHGHEAVVYLATLKVADREFWTALDPVLEKQETS
jgi:hypothetical protein